MRFRNLALNSVVFFLAILFFALFSEFILRFVWTSWKDNWDKSKNFHYSSERLNDSGNQFRENLVLTPKAKDEFRIVILGDSLSWGDKIDDDSLIWPNLLQFYLKSNFKNKNIRVINLSICGFTTVNELEMLYKNGLPFQPDLVIVGYTLNDPLPSGLKFARLSDGDIFTAKNLMPYEPWHTWLIKNLYLYSFIDTKMKNLQRKIKYPKGMLFELYKDNYAGWREGKKALNIMGTISVRTHIPFVLMLFPSFERGVKTTGQYPYVALHEKIVDVANKAHFYTLDLLPEFIKENCDFKEYHVLPLDGHPNVEAHEIIAKALTAFLLNNLLVNQ